MAQHNLYGIKSAAIFLSKSLRGFKHLGVAK